MIAKDCKQMAERAAMKEAMQRAHHSQEAEDGWQVVHTSKRRGGQRQARATKNHEGTATSQATQSVKRDVLEEWKAEQQRLKKQLVVEDKHNWYLPKQQGNASNLNSNSAVSQPSVTSTPNSNYASNASLWSKKLFPNAQLATGLVENSKQTNEVPEEVCEASSAEPLRLVGGVDLSFFRDNHTDAIAALVVCSYPDMRVVHEVFKVVELQAPYIPGYLAFREVPFLLDLIDHVKENQPEFVPQVILVDGNGILHYGGFGSASHLGVLAGIPTIGVAKKLLCVDGLTEEYALELAERCRRNVGGITAISSSSISNRSAKLVGPRSNFVHGAVLITDSKEDPLPLYVSIGHCVSLETSLNVVASCIPRGQRIPEPINQADLRSRAYVKALEQSGKLGRGSSSYANSAGARQPHQRPEAAKAIDKPQRAMPTTDRTGSNQNNTRNQRRNARIEPNPRTSADKSRKRI